MATRHNDFDDFFGDDEETPSRTPAQTDACTGCLLPGLHRTW
ncbi:hypothetical protein ACFQ0G_53745 [Streptomyces chiangmaiensis]